MKQWIVSSVSVTIVALVFLVVGYKAGEVRAQAGIHTQDIYAHNAQGVHIVSHDNGDTWFYVADGKPVPR